MHESPPALREPRPSAAGASSAAALIPRFLRTLAIAVAAGLFLAFAGAFGTAVAPLPQRLGYWLTTMILASIVGFAVITPVYALMERRPVTLAMVLSLLLSLPLTGLVWFTGALFFPGHPPADLRSLPEIFPPVLLVSVVMTAINYLAADRAARKAHRLTQAAVPGAAPPRFLERLPLKLRGGELYAVQAEDHYLRLHTSKGST